MRNSLSRRIRFAAWPRWPKPSGRMSLQRRAFWRLRCAATKGQRLDAMHILDHCARHERPEPHLRHYSPGDYSLATHAGCGRLFSSLRFWTRPASRPEGARMRAIRSRTLGLDDGPEALRYAHAREAGFPAARSV